MTKEQLIKHWEEELTFTQEQVKNNIKNNELTTALRHQLHEKSILMFIESLKQLSGETRKDFEKENCVHPYDSVIRESSGCPHCLSCGKDI